MRSKPSVCLLWGCFRRTSCTVLPVSDSPLCYHSCLNGHFVAEGCYWAELSFYKPLGSSLLHRLCWQDMAQREQVDWSERRLSSVFASELPVSLNTRVDSKVTLGRHMCYFFFFLLNKAVCMYSYICVCVCIYNSWCFVCLLCSHADVMARWMVKRLLSHSWVEHQITMHDKIAKLICHLCCSVCAVSVSVGQSDLISLPQLQFKKDKTNFSTHPVVAVAIALAVYSYLLSSWTATSFDGFLRSTTGFPTKWWPWRWTSWAAIEPTCWGRCSSWTDSTIPASWGLWVEEAPVYSA